MNCNLQHFVNRETQLAAFEARLQDREKSPVLLFHGPLGIGKTSLLYRLRACCRESKTTCALLNFQHDGLYEGEAIIHHLREQIGGDLFDAIGDEIAAIQQELPQQRLRTDTLNNWAAVSSLFAGQPATAKLIEAHVDSVGDGSQVAVGQQITQINNSQIYFMPEMESTIIRQERQRRLNKAFRDSLNRLVEKEMLVLLFDACDSATPEAVQWMRKQLLDPLSEGYFTSPTNLAIVLVGDPRGEKGGWLDEIAAWGESVAAYKLDDLPPEAVRKYWLEIRGLSEESLPPIFRSRGAPPFLMVQMANFSIEA